VLSKCELENNTSEFEKWIEIIAGLIEKIEPNVVERETIIVKAVKWSSAGSVQKNPLIHKLLARIMAKEQNYEQARYHYLLSKDGVGCARILIQLSAKAYTSEIDLILVQVVLNLLVLKEKSTAVETFDYYTRYHPKIRTYQPPFHTPILNFAYFLLNIIDEKKLQAFSTLCDLYKTALDRDPAYKQQIEKIGISYFNAPVKKPAMQGGGLFGNFFNQLFQELEDDSDSDYEDASQQQQQQPQTSRFTSAADLD
jgi:golgi to ER traffic protein 4